MKPIELKISGMWCHSCKCHLIGVSNDFSDSQKTAYAICPGCWASGEMSSMSEGGGLSNFPTVEDWLRELIDDCLTKYQLHPSINRVMLQG